MKKSSIPMERGLKVYVAGALSSKEKTNRDPSKVVVDYIANLARMCRVAGLVRRAGHYPYVPGLDFLLGFADGAFTEEDYRELGMAFLEVCDVILVTSKSLGVEWEVARAKEMGKPIFTNIIQLFPEVKNEAV